MQKMPQVAVAFENRQTFLYDGDIPVTKLYDDIASRKGIPVDFLEFFVLNDHGIRKPVMRVDSDNLVEAGTWIHCRVFKGGLCGGKGGFGVALRAQGKSRGSAATTDFASCRDLNGRRLRNVNNEILLQKRMEENELRSKGASEEDIRKMMSTPSGLKNWFLDVPTWADHAPKPQQPRKHKTELCQDWVRARKNRDPPRDAPSWWGCPRGLRCTFAHGEQDKVGSGNSKQPQSQRRVAEMEAMQSYMNEIDAIGASISSSIAQGFELSRQEQSKRKLGDLQSDHKTNNFDDDDDIRNSILCCIGGDIDIGSTGEVYGRSAFATVAMPSFAIESDGAGKFVYEVEILSITGSIQLGFATEKFESKETSLDGVGDCEDSWSLDPIREMAFCASAETAVECSSTTVGDVITLILDTKERNVRYLKNGKLVFEHGFRCTGQYIFPVVSLEENQFVRIHYDAQDIKYIGPISSAEVEIQTAKDLDAFDSAEAMESLGLEKLKQLLQDEGLKCGGTLQERAKRLYSIKGLKPSEYDASILAKPTKRPKLKY